MLDHKRSLGLHSPSGTPEVPAYRRHPPRVDLPHAQRANPMGSAEQDGGKLTGRKAEIPSGSGKDRRMPDLPKGKGNP